MSSPTKNHARDHLAGSLLANWMHANGFSDAALAREISRSDATVASWRKGTRPNPREREWLAQRLGWSWDSPPGWDTSTEPTVIAPTPPVVPPSPVETLLLAKRLLGGNEPIDPSTPKGRRVLAMCADLVDHAITRALKKDATSRQVAEVFTLAVGHQSPTEMLAYFRMRKLAPDHVLDIVDSLLRRDDEVMTQKVAEA